MKNLTRNTAAVLVITLFTGLAVFSAIQLGGRLFGASSASAQAVTTQAAVQQPAQSSGGTSDDYGYDQGSESYTDPGQSSGSESYTDPYGQTDSGSSSSSDTMTCPATGCSASTCHATE